jgi:hypothetical protein
LSPCGLKQVTNSMEPNLTWEAPVVQLLKIFLAFHGTRSLITMFPRALHRPLSWARSIQFKLRSFIMLFIHISLDLLIGLFPPLVYGTAFYILRSLLAFTPTPLPSFANVATFLPPRNIIFFQELTSLTDPKGTPSCYGMYDVQYFVHRSLLLDPLVRQKSSVHDCIQTVFTNNLNLYTCNRIVNV